MFEGLRVGLVGIAKADDCIGHAQVFEKPSGREFWRSPKGIAIIAGIGGVALLAIAAGSGSETDSSAF